MKKIKSIICLIMAIIMFTICVSAEGTKNVSFKLNFSKDEVLVSENNIISEVDNSNLNVKVIKQIGETENTIYTGPLSGYDRGKWVNVDFDNIDYMVLLDWNTLQEEVVYIMPVDNISDKKILSSDDVNSVKTTSHSITNNSFTTEVTFWNNDEYCEYIVDGKNRRIFNSCF